MTTLDDVLDTVRKRVTPSSEERDRLERTAESVIERTETAVAEIPVAADVIRVGSSARNTWLRGDRDIDIFVRFAPDLSRSELEQYGLEVGKSVFPDGRLEYAEHPYVRAEYADYAIDLVPCFAIEDATDIRSAVDRTPFHAEYIAERMTESIATEVRLLKRFSEAIGVYGSDLKTEGFSGYLTELLILEYGGFIEVLEAATTWNPPVLVDPEAHAEATFNDPLVVIDPTDPTRNVAAVVTAETVSRFQHHARTFLRDPTISAFERYTPESLSVATFAEYIADRDTTPVGIRIPIPDMVDDQLYPQLRTSMRGIVSEVESHGFSVLRADAFSVDTALIYFEVETAVLPAVERHAGPPVYVQDHANAFLDQWTDSPAYGPFIEGDRYIVERYRDSRSISAIVTRERLDAIKLGRDVRRAMQTDFDLLVGEDVTELLPEYANALATYYEPRP